MLDSEESLKTGSVPFKIDVANLPNSVLDSWCQDISDPALRTAVLNMPHLKERIFQDMLKERGVNLGDQEDPFENQELVSELFETNLEELCLELGCAWHAKRLAIAIASCEHKEIISDLPRKALQSGLKFRSYKSLSKSPKNFSAQVLKNEGRLCVAAWISTLPKSVEVQIEIALGFDEDSRRIDALFHRAKLCRAVIAERMSDGIPQ